MTESPPTSINLERAAHKKLHTLEFGEYLTGRLVLEAFDALENGTLH